MGILFVATPHAGSSLATWAARLAKSLNIVKRTNSDLVAVLRDDSEVLERIQNEFPNMLRRREEDGQSPVKITCFYEELPMEILGDVVYALFFSLFICGELLNAGLVSCPTATNEILGCESIISGYSRL